MDSEGSLAITLQPRHHHTTEQRFRQQFASLKFVHTKKKAADKSSESRMEVLSSSVFRIFQPLKAQKKSKTTQKRTLRIHAPGAELTSGLV